MAGMLVSKKITCLVNQRRFDSIVIVRLVLPEPAVQFELHDATQILDYVEFFRRLIDQNGSLFSELHGP